MPTVPIPPPELRFMDATEDGFLAIGDEIADDLERLCDMAPTAAVVDVGCGYGRVAHALLRRPGFEGDYLGFDILERHVAWCRAQLTPQSEGRFRFEHLDVRNARYNPEGAAAAVDVRFPAADASADVIVVTSVFTHLYPDEVAHYMHELARVLRPGGRALVTFFLIDDFLRTSDGGKALERLMPHEGGPGWRYGDAEDPLRMVGYDDAWVRDALGSAGLTIVSGPRPGTWSGQGAPPAYQDTLVAARRA